MRFDVLAGGKVATLKGVSVVGFPLGPDLRLSFSFVYRYILFSVTLSLHPNHAEV